MSEEGNGTKRRPIWRAGSLAASIAAMLTQIAAPAIADEQIRALLTKAKETGVRALRDHGRLVRQLVLKPSRSGGFLLAGHVSHASHASHQSHASHYSGAGESAPPPAPTDVPNATPTPNVATTPTPQHPTGDSKRPAPKPTKTPTPAPSVAHAYRVTLTSGQVLLGTIARQLGGFLITYRSNDRPMQLWVRTDQVKSMEPVP